MSGLAQFDVAFLANSGLSLPGDYDSRNHRYMPKYVRKPAWALQMDATDAVRRAFPDWPRPFKPPGVDFYEWRAESIVPHGQPPRFDPVVRHLDVHDNLAHPFLELPTLYVRPAHMEPGAPPDAGARDHRKREVDLRITLTVRHDDGRIERTRKDYRLRDYMVAVLGDSYAAGEGNPDQPGSLGIGGGSVCTASTASITAGLEPPMDDDPTWLEPGAHRSRLSGHLLAAMDAGGVDRRVLRFITPVSFATSGAEIVKGLLNPQNDWQEGGQLDELERAQRQARRDLDAVVLSIGGNDVGFAPALRSLTKGHFQVVTIFGAFGLGGQSGSEVIADVKRRLAALPDNLDAVARRLQLLHPGVVLITEYPTGLFNDAQGSPADGCGIFDSDFGGLFRISRREAEIITDFGRQLNSALRTAAQRHGWVYVSGIDAAFARHGYCSGQSFFVFAEDSCRSQGDFDGIMHPNGKGHEVYHKQVLAALLRHLPPIPPLAPSVPDERPDLPPGQRVDHRRP